MSGSPTSDSTRPTISDERLKAATGRSRVRWYRMLDSVGADEWDHKTIERWLGGKREVDAWWVQCLTADYERDRGLHDRDQSRDGTFTATASKTIRTSIEELWPFIDDDDLRRSWLDCELGVSGRSPGLFLRLEAADGSRIKVTLHELDDTASGEPRTRVGVDHRKLSSAEELQETKAFWKACLQQLADALEDELV